MDKDYTYNKYNRYEDPKSSKFIIPAKLSL